ncbi:hypothetical protein JYQ62_19950 [Nostoc sp. UHCC 0702]|nr:hypothetical protein JYQ62_19950 [Nostoc sp. UHCC 0702]
MVLADKIAGIMKANGLRSVKVFKNDDTNVVVQGNLGDRCTLVFKKDSLQDENQYYTVLDGGADKGTIAIWYGVTDENFPSIIKSAQIYTKQFADRRFMPITLILGIILLGLLSAYVGNQIRSMCNQVEKTELVR